MIRQPRFARFVLPLLLSLCQRPGFWSPASAAMIFPRPPASPPPSRTTACSAISAWRQAPSPGKR